MTPDLIELVVAESGRVVGRVESVSHVDLVGAFVLARMFGEVPICIDVPGSMTWTMRTQHDPETGSLMYTHVEVPRVCINKALDALDDEVRSLPGNFSYVRPVFATNSLEFVGSVRGYAPEVSIALRRIRACVNNGADLLPDAQANALYAWEGWFQERMQDEERNLRLVAPAGVPEKVSSVVHSTFSAALQSKAAAIYVGLLQLPDEADVVDITPRVNYEAMADDMLAHIPGAASVSVRCPVCGGDVAPAPLREAIISLNDHHKWTREAIADWLDSLHEQGLVDLTVQFDDEGEEG